MASIAFCTMCRPGTGNCPRQRCAPSRIVNSDPSALWVISLALNRTLRCPRENDLRPRPLRNALTECIVRVENDRSLRANRFG